MRIKKIISAVLSFAVLISVFVINTNALTSGVFGYKIVDDSLEITSYIGSSETAVIPETIIGYPVKSIAEKAFRYSSIKSVTIPKGVISIKQSAFSDCKSLKSVKLPETLESIGDTAFYNCENLSSSIRFPKSLKTIGDSAFENCWDMTYAIVPKTVETIGYCAFGYYYSTDANEKYYDFKRSDFRIFGYEDSAASEYADKMSLEFCDLNKGVSACTSNEMDFFIDASSNAELSYYAGSSKKPSIPSKVSGHPVKYIGAMSFYGSDITSVTIPSSVTEVREWAFENCADFKSIRIPPTVKTIKQGAFGYFYKNGINDTYSDVIICGALSSAAKKYAADNYFPFKDVYTTTLKLAKTSGTVYIKGSLYVNGTVVNPFGKTKFISSDKKIAKVNSGGKVTGLKAGKTKINVVNNNVKKVFTITVKKPKLNKTSSKIKRGRIYQLTVTGKIGTAEFISENKKILKVNKKTGKYKGLKKGKTYILVKTNGINLRCKVKII